MDKNSKIALQPAATSLDHQQVHNIDVNAGLLVESGIDFKLQMIHLTSLKK
jgi:hypothetical protein